MPISEPHPPAEPKRSKLTLALTVVGALLATLLVGVALPRTAKATVANRSPIGHVDLVAFDKGTLVVNGWAIDPDTKGSIDVRIDINGVPTTYLANALRLDVAKAYLGYGAPHGFNTARQVPNGSYRVCVVARNVGPGVSTSIGCRSLTITNNPGGHITNVTAAPGGVHIEGWVIDPNTRSPITVDANVDHTHRRVLANAPSAVAGARFPYYGSNHGFALNIPASLGTHVVCVGAFNVGLGGNTKLGCLNFTLSGNPFGFFDTVTRVSTASVTAAGWAIDASSLANATVRFTVDGAASPLPPVATALSRPDIAARFPAYPGTRGFTADLALDTNPHTVCAIAVNTGAGVDKLLGCRYVPSTGDTVPAAPAIQVWPGNTKVDLTWLAARSVSTPVTDYTVTISPAVAGQTPIVVAGTATGATVTGLKNGTTYAFTVRATNALGTGSPSSGRGAPSLIPPQFTPAPVSTSHYVRNLTGNLTTDAALMRRMGAIDAGYNPSGHRYLVLLQIGGQDQARGGVLLSATSRFVSNAAVVNAMNAYLDGYSSRQRQYAPMTLAIGTNNDVDVSAAAGASWARYIVNPVVSYARKFPTISVGGANDMEPGFSATVAETRAWLTGYLAATTARFVFNGSADGCSTIATARACNNGWKMADLQWLSGGAAPSRTISLPQIYNTAMPLQWKYISLTGTSTGRPRIYFGGPLTEFTACSQAGSCYSMGNTTAWSHLWSAISSNPATRQYDMPHGTDLRIN